MHPGYQTQLVVNNNFDNTFMKGRFIMLNKSSLGPAILNLEKNNNTLLVDVTLNEFAVVNNSITKQKMIALL